MLIRNCVSNLFKANDENVRVTIFKKNPRFYIQGGYIHSFLETVRNMLGPGIFNNDTETLCFTLIYEVAGNTIYRDFYCTGKQIVQEITKLVDYPTSLRVECRRRWQSRSKRSWIVLVM